MFQRILVPLDGSALAERAIPAAVRIARVSGGSILLLRVAHIPAQLGPYLYASSPSRPPLSQEILDADLLGVQYYLAGIAQAENLEGITTETVARSGAAAQTILKTVKAENVDLIVLSSHGETGLKRWVLGSVAQKVARQSPVPVLVLREGDLEPVGGQPLRALVALDGSSLAESALAPAASLIAALAAPAPGAVHLARLVHLPTVQSEDESLPDELDRRTQAQLEATRYLSTVAETLRSAVGAALGLKITWSVTQNGDVADALIRMAELGEETGTVEVKGCDLIAIAAHGRGGFQRWMMGSITERILDGTKLPLLIVRPQGQHMQAPGELAKETAAVI